jgi:hypothetical protein
MTKIRCLSIKTENRRGESRLTEPLLKTKKNPNC